jgi:virginiamycin B lyase
VITEYAPSTVSSPRYIAPSTSVPDSSMWFTEQTQVGHVTTNGSAVGGLIAKQGLPGAGPLVGGPDNNMWVAAWTGADGRINRLVPSSSSWTITEYPIVASQGINGITVGPDNNIWFATITDRIGRITTSGVVTRFRLPNPNAAPYGIAKGPDGNLWFTENTGNKIGRITPSGVVTEFPVPTANAGLRGIVAGPDGNLWFTEYTGNKIGRIVP